MVAQRRRTMLQPQARRLASPASSEGGQAGGHHCVHRARRVRAGESSMHPVEVRAGRVHSPSVFLPPRSAQHCFLLFLRSDNVFRLGGAPTCLFQAAPPLQLLSTLLFAALPFIVSVLGLLRLLPGCPPA